MLNVELSSKTTPPLCFFEKSKAPPLGVVDIQNVWFLRCAFIHLSEKNSLEYTKYARKIFSLIRIKSLSKNYNVLKNCRFSVRTKKKSSLRLAPNGDFSAVIAEKMLIFSKHSVCQPPLVRGGVKRYILIFKGLQFPRRGWS